MAKNYKVGYGKPPEENQFMKGHSGNPKGRPVGKKNFATIFQEVTEEIIHLTENGRKRSVTKLHAILLQIVNKAISGDLKAAREILHLNQIFQAFADEGFAETPDKEKDAAVMELLLQRMRVNVPKQSIKKRKKGEFDEPID